MWANQTKPKLLTRKPKGLPRASGQALTGMDGQSPPGAAPPPPPKPSFFYRARGAFGALLTLNIVVAGYMLFRGPSLRTSREASEGVEEKESSETESSRREDRQDVKDQDGDKDVVQWRANSTSNPDAQLMKTVEAAAFAPMALQTDALPVAEATLSTPPPVKQALSDSQVKEILTWMLCEKRKERPNSREEKTRIDADKRLIKDFLRAKKHPPLA